MNRVWIAALVLAATACSGSGGSDGGGDTPDAASLEQAYRAYIKAFLDGDGAAAYVLLSQRCQDKESLSEFAPIAESAAEIYGQVDYKIDDVSVDGDTGTVEATYAVDALNSPGGSTWVYEDGGWRSDKCA